LQRVMLERRGAMESRASMEGTYAHVGLGKATETAIVELEFAFWMTTLTSTPDCAAIPDDSATDDAVFAFLDMWNSPSGYDDASMATADQQYSYQVRNQLGYPVWEHQHLDDLMQYSYEDWTPLMPVGVALPDYDPSTSRDLAQWVVNDADHVMLLDGEWD